MCVLYGVCMLFPGIVDPVALLIGAFEVYVGTRAANSGVATQRTAADLAVAPSAVREALRWRDRPGATTSWRAPRLHYGQGATRDVVRDFIGAHGGAVSSVPVRDSPPPPPPQGAFGPLLLGGGVAYKSEETPPPCWRPLGPIATSRPRGSTKCTCHLVGKPAK